MRADDRGWGRGEGEWERRGGVRGIGNSKEEDTGDGTQHERM